MPRWAYHDSAAISAPALQGCSVGMAGSLKGTHCLLSMHLMHSHAEKVKSSAPQTLGSRRHSKQQPRRSLPRSELCPLQGAERSSELNDLGVHRSRRRPGTGSSVILKAVGALATPWTTAGARR